MLLFQSISLLFFLLFLTAVSSLNKNIHVFFALGYENEHENGQYLQWNHPILPHHLSTVSAQYPQIGTNHSPPSILHSTYYPLKGPYSSKSYETLLQQFNEINIGSCSIVVLSWWGRDHSSSDNIYAGPIDNAVKDLMKAADDHGQIKVIFHLEAYSGRSIDSIYDNIHYLIDSYSHYESFYLDDSMRIPMFYISHFSEIPSHDWLRLLSNQGDLSVRNTTYDAFFIGLWHSSDHGVALRDSGFDGAYTYYASDGASYGATSDNWGHICEFCRDSDMMCILSVGPGYNDTGIRPWNKSSIRARE